MCSGLVCAMLKIQTRFSTLFNVLMIYGFHFSTFQYFWLSKFRMPPLLRSSRYKKLSAVVEWSKRAACDIQVAGTAALLLLYDCLLYFPPSKGSVVIYVLWKQLCVTVLTFLPQRFILDSKWEQQSKGLRAATGSLQVPTGSLQVLASEFPPVWVA